MIEIWYAGEKIRTVSDLEINNIRADIIFAYRCLAKENKLDFQRIFTKPYWEYVDCRKYFMPDLVEPTMSKEFFRRGCLILTFLAVRADSALDLNAYIEKFSNSLHWENEDQRLFSAIKLALLSHTTSGLDEQLKVETDWIMKSFVHNYFHYHSAFFSPGGQPPKAFYVYSLNSTTDVVAIAEEQRIDQAMNIGIYLELHKEGQSPMCSPACIVSNQTILRQRSLAANDIDEFVFCTSSSAECYNYKLELKWRVDSSADDFLGVLYWKEHESFVIYERFAVSLIEKGQVAWKVPLSISPVGGCYLGPDSLELIDEESKTVTVDAKGSLI